MQIPPPGAQRSSEAAGATRSIEGAGLSVCLQPGWRDALSGPCGPSAPVHWRLHRRAGALARDGVGALLREGRHAARRRRLQLRRPTPTRARARTAASRASATAATITTRAAITRAAAALRAAARRLPRHRRGGRRLALLFGCVRAGRVPDRVEELDDLPTGAEGAHHPVSAARGWRGYTTERPRLRASERRRSRRSTNLAVERHRDRDLAADACHAWMHAWHRLRGL